MRTVPLPTGAALRLYSSIFELPAGRHSEFEYWLVRGAGIGAGGVADIERHFAQTTALLGAGETEKAADALALLHYAFAQSLERFNPQHLAFGCLVAEWPVGVPFTDVSEEGLTHLVAELSAAGLTQGLVQDELEFVKKNFAPS
jgi:hypothetical protein